MLTHNEVNREKLQIELDECREKKEIIEENFQRTKLECQNLIKENEKKCLLLNVIDVKIKNLIGNNSSKNIEFNLNELEKQWKNCQLKINSLEEKLIERDNGTLQLTQKLEEQVYNLKHDLDQRHQIFLTQKNQLLQSNQNHIQNLTLQLQKMEIRANENEQLLKLSNEKSEKLNNEKDKIELILKHVISLWIPIRLRYNQLIDSNRFIKQELNKYNKIKQILNLNKLIKKKTFRIYIITIIAFKRFIIIKNKSSFKYIYSSNIIYDQYVLSTFNSNFIQLIHIDDIFQSLIIQLNRFYAPFTKGEKQAQELLNEQNNQLKSLTDIIHQTQKEKDFIQDKFDQIYQNDIYSKDKIQQLTKSQQQMDDNVKRAEKAIRLVVNDKEQISSYCNRINSALNVSEKRGLEYIEQLISQLDALVQLPSNQDQSNKSPPELISCQTMAIGFVNLLNRLKKLLINYRNDIESLKEHCQMLTEQFRQLSEQDISQIDSTQTVLIQSHPLRLQVNHHPQSAFKPIKPDMD
ncbi:unnamed protein product [Rotaria sp. Silwood1]|nr:unnamed protein product [Rotaria sp. Silwood1]